MTNRRFPVFTRDGSPMTIPWAVAEAAIRNAGYWKHLSWGLWEKERYWGGLQECELDGWLAGTEHENWREQTK